MFAALIPAFLLPPIAVVAVWVGEKMRGFGEADLLALVIGFFMFIQLGSQVLNAWLVLRRPASLHTRALPRTLSIVNALSYGLIIVWSLVLFFLSETGWGVAFGGALAILGVVALFTIIGARMRDASEAGSSPSSGAHPVVGFSARARGFTWGYLVVATVGLIASAVLTIGQSTQDAALPPIAGIAAFVLVILGLPWSHTLYGTVFMAIVLTSDGEHGDRHHSVGFSAASGADCGVVLQTPPGVRIQWRSRQR
jgi:hypothetical protein